MADKSAFVGVGFGYYPGLESFFLVRIAVGCNLLFFLFLFILVLIFRRRSVLPSSYPKANLTEHHHTNHPLTNSKRGLNSPFLLSLLISSAVKCLPSFKTTTWGPSSPPPPNTSPHSSSSSSSSCSAASSPLPLAHRPSFGRSGRGSRPPREEADEEDGGGTWGLPKFWRKDGF